ncbi:triple tyrosine motif-containing protein [Cytobacillus firmus]|uniref:triple tyrosine motif-containing protein n=1 Tax=Cytobacillus firmus TaxID=1399 RepID=UPI001CFCCDDE|nr:triple tyrosine motif-containing protein [Cytobacillus firmus]
MKFRLIVIFIISLLISGCAQQTNKEEENQNSKESQPKIEKVVVDQKSSTLKIESVAKGNNIRYAFYIYKDNELLEKVKYQQERQLSYSVKDSGVYKVKVFVKDAKGNIETQYTEEIKITN